MIKRFLVAIANAIFLLCFYTANSQQPLTVITAAPGVQVLSTGTLDRFTPYSFCGEKPMLP